MATYLQAVLAAWGIASVLFIIFHMRLLKRMYRAIPDSTIDEKIYLSRLPLNFLSRLALAFVLVYLLNEISPAGGSWATGLVLGATLGAAVYLSRAFDHLAAFATAPGLLIAVTVAGIIETAAAGVLAALVR